jgi:hypothetical protein
MGWQVILISVLALPFLLLPVAFTYYLQAGGLYQAIRRAQMKKVPPELACSTDADCPLGYVCVNGKCVPAV